MVGMQSLHLRNIYYGDMKAPNCLIYRSQEVKIGDLGISIKMNYNPTSTDESLYYPKGLTEGFVTKEIEAAFEK